LSIVLPFGMDAKSNFTLSVGGFINPRSFAPTGPFVINTLDTDGVSIIDTGYNQTAAMN